MTNTEDRIRHYQRNIDRITAGSNTHNNERLLHCIGQLNKLPVTVHHLQITGVGRTVNALRKIEDGIGESAKQLVAKWKVMVANASTSSEEDEACVPDAPESYDSPNNSMHTSRIKNEQNDDSLTENKYSTYSEAASRSPEMVINTDDMENSFCDSKDQETDSNFKEEKEKHKHKSSKHSSYKDRNINSKDKYESLKNSEMNDHKIKKEKSKTKSDFPESSSNLKKRRHDSDSTEYIKKKRHKSESGEEENTYGNNMQSFDEEKEEDGDQKQEQEEDSDQMEIAEEVKKVSSKDQLRDKKSSQKSESCSDKSKSKSKHHSSSSSHGDKSKKHLSSKISDSEKDVNHCKQSKTKSSHSSSKDKSKDEKSKEKESHNKLLKDDKEKSSHKSSKDKSKSKEENESEEHKRHKDHKKKKHKDHKEKKRVKKDEDVSDNDDGGTGIDCNSGTSFGDALGMCMMPVNKSKKKKESSSSSSSKLNKVEQPSSSKSSSSKTPSKSKQVYNSPDSPNALSLLSTGVKLEPLQISDEVDLSATLPEPCLNYKPLPQIVSQRKYDEDLMLAQVIHAKTQRTKVYSGNKGGYSKIPTLLELCTRVLIENIDALEFTGGVPYHVLKPVLERATADQLFMLENYNDYLIEDTDELWRFHCNKDFRTKQREEMESWREMYMRCVNEREAKFKALTANIKNSIDNSQPVRSTKLAYVDVVKPPRNVIRKQARFGTANVTSKSSEAKKKIIAAASGAGGSGIPPIAERVPAPVPLGRSRNISTGTIKKPKAPLMMKTLQALKGRFKR